jgi:hypothetical protein
VDNRTKNLSLVPLQLSKCAFTHYLDDGLY